VDDPPRRRDQPRQRVARAAGRVPADHCPLESASIRR
jgi:hypothetical protein